MNKELQRMEICQRMAELSPSYCQMSDEAILHRILNLKEYHDAAVIFSYVSVDGEVNTRQVIEDAWHSGKRVAVPKCIKKGIMKAYEIYSWEDLSPGKYGILEPKTSCKMVHASEISFAVIPCLSCDREGNRLGHGGGYYDRYLLGTDFLKAAVCREQMLLKYVCCEEHDQPVDLVLTEARSYKAKQKNAAVKMNSV